MHKRLISAIFTTALTALFLTPTAALAGSDSGSPATGGFYSDGSGYCSGTLNGFLASPGTSNYLVLEEYAFTDGVGGYIQCRYNGNFKYAVLDPSDAPLFNAFKQIVDVPHEVHIYVHWNTSGYVDAFQVFNSSSFH